MSIQVFLVVVVKIYNKLKTLNKGLININAET